MKKIWEWIKGALGTISSDVVIDSVFKELGEVGEEALEKFIVQEPQLATSFIQGFYSFIPLLQTAAAKTKTKFDDKAVAEARKDIEDFAAKHSIDLPQLPAASTATDDKPVK